MEYRIEPVIEVSLLIVDHFESLSGIVSRTASPRRNLALEELIQYKNILISKIMMKEGLLPFEILILCS